MLVLARTDDILALLGKEKKGQVLSDLPLKQNI